MENVIHVYRKDTSSHSRVLVGSIVREPDLYKFSYSEKYKNSSFFVPIFPFLQKDTEYSSSNLFPVFASRLPDPKRRDIEQILSKYNMTEYDQFTLLQKSQGRLPIDTLEFVSELSEDEADGCQFYIAGISHHSACCLQCDHIKLKQGDKLSLVRENNNAYDDNAVQFIYKNTLIGYVPLYYSKTFSKLIANGKTLTATILTIKDCTCDKPNSNDCYDCVNIQVSVSVN